MKKGIKKLLVSVLTVFIVASVSTSCKKYYYDGATMEVHHFTVYGYNETNQADRWVWNSAYQRHECVMELKELDERLYEKGTIAGAVYISEDIGNGQYAETLKNLPYVQTFEGNRTVPFYTQTISFDVVYGSPSTICFYVQTSNPEIFRGDVDGYDFKINFIWEPKKKVTF